MFGMISCLDASVWLECNTDFVIVVHPDAELDGIAGILKPLIDQGKLPSDTNETLSSIIQDMRGKALTVWDAIPKFFKEQSKREDELIALGLLASRTTPTI